MAGSPAKGGRPSRFRGGAAPYHLPIIFAPIPSHAPRRIPSRRRVRCDSMPRRISLLISPAYCYFARRWHSREPNARSVIKQRASRTGRGDAAAARVTRCRRLTRRKPTSPVSVRSRFNQPVGCGSDIALLVVRLPPPPAGVPGIANERNLCHICAALSGARCPNITRRTVSPILS